MRLEFHVEFAAAVTVVLAIVENLVSPLVQTLCNRVSLSVVLEAGVFVPHIVWLWNVVKAWGMYDFARAR